jgi:hypothetical protein
MGEKTGEGQSGGVNISGTVGSVGGDIVGRDKIVGAPSAAALDAALRPLIEATRQVRLRTAVELSDECGVVDTNDPDANVYATASEVGPCVRVAKVQPCRRTCGRTAAS